MGAAWLRTKWHPRRGAGSAGGFMAVEVLLAATVFGFLAVATAGAFVYARQATVSAGEYNRAVALADEGIEAIRNIRDNSYAALATSSTRLVSGATWSLSTGAEPAIGIFTRSVSISDVDSTHKLATVTVSWTTGPVSRQVTSTSRFTNWRAAIVVPGPTMMVYSKTTNTPFYRIWDGSNWGAEGSAGTVGGNINYVVAKSARTRNETIMGTQDSTGAIYVQIWNGSSWTNKTQVGTGTAANRGFDIAYERSNDRALIVYQPTAASADFAWRTWDGTTLSAGTTVTTPPTTGATNWIEIDQNPLSASNDVAMIMFDANSDIYGMLWNGSSWGTMGTAVAWDTTASTSTAKKCIDVEYEQTSGDIMFIWGDSVATDQYYRTYVGTTLSAATLLDIAAEGGIAEWLQLSSRPSSNEIMLGVQDAGADLNTRKWSGSAWDAAAQHAEHSAATENILSRNFDIVWETHSSNPGEAWLVWGDGIAAGGVIVKQWSGAAWGGNTTLTGSDDTSFIRLRADAAGNVLSGIYQNSTAAVGARDINDRHLSGGLATWTDKTTIWGGATGADPVFFRVDIATP